MSNELKIVKQIMEERCISMSKIAKRLGVSHQSMWIRLNGENRGGMNTRTFTEMLNALGYDLVVMPQWERDLYEKNKDCYVVEVEKK